MGQKTHPRGIRLGIVETWDSRWISNLRRDYPIWLQEDLRIQQFVKERMSRAAVARVSIERWDSGRFTVHIHTARPGIVIGRRGQEVEKLTQDLEKTLGKPVRIAIEEIRRPELEAQLVAEGVAAQIERRTPFKQAMKRTVANTMRAGAEGCKIVVGGRLGGHDIARSEKEIQGRVPLHTLRADIQYGFAEANTTFGKIGVKAWVFRGEVIGGGSAGETKRLLSRPGSGTTRGGRDVQGSFDDDGRGGRGGRPGGGTPSGGRGAGRAGGGGGRGGRGGGGGRR